MFSLKKTTAAVLALSSSAVFAGTMGPICSPGSVTVPCEHMAWDFGGQAIYLQIINNSDFAFSNESRDNSKWNWGFQLEASYHFNTGNDININWYHIDTSTQFFAVTDEVIGLGLLGGINHKWDAVNGELGQFIDFSPTQKMRLHGGFQYARIKTNRAVIAADPLVFVDQIEQRNQYNGFGPRTGIDMSYGFVNGFNIYAKAATALLVGTAKFNGSGISLLGFGPIAVSGSKTTIVPELEAKLGANYTYAMAQGELTLDGGYMWFNYFNAVRTTPHIGGELNSNDFGASGPYVGLKYVGNV
ncbi:Lpg1974 family pore-forming outer membrane protein [Legionella sp.]|uniref:Lpg1974 family pore-forming outer membrane protein n=1 Tax=Legionella sp. TaxID=459 RepID=UPI003CAF4B00